MDFKDIDLVKLLKDDLSLSYNKEEVEWIVRNVGKLVIIMLYAFDSETTKNPLFSEALTTTGRVYEILQNEFKKKDK